MNMADFTNVRDRGRPAGQPKSSKIFAGQPLTDNSKTQAALAGGPG
jgi:hypothetical protein